MGLLGAIAHHPRLAALAGGLCIAFSGIFYRFSGAGPETATVFRALYGLPLLVLVAWSEHRAYGPLPRRTVGLAILAGIFFAGDLNTWHHAIEFVGAGLATVLGNMQVVVVAIAAWLLFGERPSRRVVIALPVVLSGAVLISGVVGSGAYGKDPLLGVVFGLACALCYAGYLLTIRRAGGDRRRTGGPVAVSTAATGIAGLVVGLALGDVSFVPTWPTHGWLALYGLTSQSVGYLLIGLSLPRLPAVVTSIILLSQPVATVLLARVLLAETPSAGQIAGVVLIIGGIAFATAPIGRIRDRVAEARAK